MKKVFFTRRYTLFDLFMNGFGVIAIMADHYWSAAAFLILGPIVSHLVERKDQ